MRSICESRPPAWLVAAALLGAAASAGALGRPPADRERVNIVLIYADDLGYDDLRCYNPEARETPHLDSLARDGVRFTQAYVSQSLCAPSRAGLLTGRYPSRFHFESLTGNLDHQMEADIGVPRSERLLTEVLHDAGYETAVIGKWHLGANPQFRPGARGVGHFFGFLGGMHSYFTWDEPVRGKSGGKVYRDDAEVEEGAYLTEAFTRDACEFIRRDRDRPFFLYLPLPNDHTPIEVPQRYVRGAGMPAVRAGMIQALDDSVGQVLQCLDEEGGIRVPLLMRWPGKLAAGTLHESPVIQLDLFPTILQAAGVALPKDRDLDGISLLPGPSGASTGAPSRALFFRSPPSWAVREGPWKLSRIGGGAPFLADLTLASPESENLAGDHPEIVERLTLRYEEWEKKILAEDR